MVKKVNNVNSTDTNDLVKKFAYGTKVGKIEKKINNHDPAKYITTQEFN